MPTTSPASIVSRSIGSSVSSTICGSPHWLPVAAARADLYANAINETLIARPGTWLTRALVFVDNKGVDGVVNGTAALLGGSSGRLRRLQTGFVRSYALGMLGGAIVVIAFLLAVSYS